MAEQTKNYGLTKPADDDFYSISVQNENMDVLDTEVKRVEDLCGQKEDCIKNAEEKTALEDGDTIPLSDEAAAMKTKKITVSNVKQSLKSYFDAQYNEYVHPTTAGNNHIPVGGAAGQILRWRSDGAADWGADNAANVQFDSAGTGLAAANVQDAVCEVNHQLSVVADRDPRDTDTGYAPGRQWVNSDTGAIWICTADGWVCGQPYDGTMQTFFAIPGASGKIRLKIQMPDDADGVMVRYKSSKWTNGTDTNLSGTLAINTQQNYYGDNVWYEVTGLTDGQEFYFAAFAYKGTAYNDVITADNTTLCRAGGLIAEYTFDSVSGTTITDTSGNGNNATAYNAITYSPSMVANGVRGDGVSARVDLANNIWLRGDATVTFFYKLNSIPASNKTSVILDFCGTSFKKNNLTTLAFVCWAGTNAVSLHNGDAYVDLPILDTSWHFIANAKSQLKVDYQYDASSKETKGNVNTAETRADRHVLLAATELDNTRYTNATLDQVRVFGRKLECYEISALYNNGQGC